MSDTRAVTLQFVVNVPVVVTDGTPPYIHLGGVAEAVAAALVDESCWPDHRIPVGPKVATLTTQIAVKPEKVVESLRELAKTKWWAKEELKRRGEVVEAEEVQP